ncbi:MAG: DUF6265 family protein [Pyrinomonadaceae bacterium]
MLSWVSGCWEMRQGDSVTVERWAKPTENLMLGISQTTKGTKSTAFENLRIVNNGHGLFYIARPGDAKADTPFMVKTMTANEIVFENPKNDFPQRIIYRLEKSDSLFARIEGKNGEKEMAIDFPFKRIKCE